MEHDDCLGPERSFRGVNCPVELFDLVEQGTLSGEVAFLALTIDSLVNVKGEGCWASKAFLAKKVGKTSRQVQRDLKILEGYREEDGQWVWRGPRLIRQVGWKTVRGQRYRILETRWSRIDLSEHNNTGGETEMSPRGETEMSPRGGRQKCLPRSNGSNSKLELMGEERASRRLPPGDSPSGPFAEGIPEFCYTWYDQAHKLLRSKTPPIPLKTINRKNGAEYFHKLWEMLGADAQRIDRFLKRYEIKINSIEKPVPCSVKQLCNPEVFYWLERQLEDRPQDKKISKGW